MLEAIHFHQILGVEEIRLNIFLYMVGIACTDKVQVLEKV